MRRTALRTTVVLGSLAAVIAVGCASMETAKMTPGEAVAERQKLMKANGAAWKNVQANTKAGNIAAVAADADTLAENAKKIPALFPEGSIEGKTAAKPEIWKDWPKFAASAKNMGYWCATSKPVATKFQACRPGCLGDPGRTRLIDKRRQRA